MLCQKKSRKIYFNVIFGFAILLVLGYNFLIEISIGKIWRSGGVTWRFAQLIQKHQIDIENDIALSITAKPWFFKNGENYPKPAAVQGQNKLFPYQDPHSDRIINQLMYVPHNYDEIRKSGKLKTIVLYQGYDEWDVEEDRDVFVLSKCPVDTCKLTKRLDLIETADMILYKNWVPSKTRDVNRTLLNSKQVSMIYYLESPYHTPNSDVPHFVNWTATYRRDSDIVAPYEKWQYYDPKVHQIEQNRNYAANKTKKVAWFVSNCQAANGRLDYARELAKYIDVDIYGACGSHECPKSDHCFKMLDDHYKFYLALENSNCKDYITEKLFENALKRNILPIVMGARIEDYRVSAPHHSYIHVEDFDSVKMLAEYLHILDKDDELYNSYFKWKGTGEFINTYFWCRVCAALHYEDALKTPRWQSNINDWWGSECVCTTDTWSDFNCKAKNNHT